MSFEGKVVIVTGASSGIGAATAKLFAEEGAHVTMVDIDETNLKEVAQVIAKIDKKPLSIKADVTNEKDVKEIIKKTIDNFGKIDVLVNNAGILRFVSIMGGNYVKVFDELINVNLRSIVLLTTYATPHLIESKGNIVNVSSTAASKCPRVANLVPYSVSKAGVDSFTKGAALELAEFGIRVNAVCPGAVKTNIMKTTGLAGRTQMSTRPPLGKISEPEELADLIMFLASDKARSVTGSIYVCDNGMLLQ